MEIITAIENPQFPEKVPFISIPISGSASFGAQQYGTNHHAIVFPNAVAADKTIPSIVFNTIGTNNPVLRAKYRHKGICQTDARIIPILPAMLCKREYTAVAGEMILLIEISNAKNIAETSSFSIKIMPLANSNFERFTGIENTE